MTLCTVSAESELLDKVSSWVGGFSVNEFHPSSTSSHKSNEFINEMHLLTPLPRAGDRMNERRVVLSWLAGIGTVWTVN